MKMLSVKTHQILGASSHTEYLQPSTPSSPIDAKKSPLALLAATCSNIGKPDPPPTSKPTLTVSPEKNDQKSDLIDDKSSFKPYKHFDKGSRSPVELSLHGCEIPKIKTPSSVMDAHSNGGKFDMNGVNHGGMNYPVNDIAAVNGHLHSLHNRISLSCGANGMFVEVNQEAVPKVGVSLPANPALTPSPCKGQNMLSTLPLAAALPHGAIPTTACGCLQPLLAHHTTALPLDLRANSNQSKPPTSPTSLGGNTPYAAYATVKTATGATALVPICRDPYCMNCQNAIRLASASPANNNNGCTQCGHSTPSFGLNGILPLSLAPFASLGHPVVSQAGPSPADNPLTSPSHLYSSNTSVLSTAGNNNEAKVSTYVCNWVSGGSSCGKRFPSSEDLLQHLRSHTVTANVESPVTSSTPVSNCHVGHHISSLADSLKSKYPSVLSSLNSNRYHPYKTSFASTAPITALPLPAPGAYLPYPPTPYVLYDMGQRV